MQVTQIATLMNTITGELLGNSELVQEDLSNIVDVGTELFNATNVDNYVKTLVDHIGRMVFVNRSYAGRAPSVLMDAWEYGSVLEKITIDGLPTASDNESWNLTNGETYNQDIFYKPSVSAKFFNNKRTFEVDVSFTDIQVRESFDNASQLNAFISMIYNAVEKTMTVKMDAFIMRTINNFIGETVNDAYAVEGEALDITGAGNARAVNLLARYNTLISTPLTADKAIYDKDFIRYCAYVLKLYADRLQTISALFNMGGKDRFTPRDLLHVVMLSEFKAGADVYLQSDTFHNEFVTFPESESVAFWQGSGTSFSFDDTSSINVKTASGDEIEVTGILCVMFDRYALGVTNYDRRVTAHYNAKAEFTNNYFKFDCGAFNDFNENFVVFFIA